MQHHDWCFATPRWGFPAYACARCFCRKCCFFGDGNENLRSIGIYASTPATPASTGVLPPLNFSTGSLLDASAQRSLPSFWPNNVKEFFNFAETFFDIHGIADEQGKFCCLVRSLSDHQAVIRRISDVISSSRNSLNPYTRLRESLIERLCADREGSIAQILLDSKRESSSVREYFFHLKSRLGDRYNPNSLTQRDMLRYCILNSIDSSTRPFLYPFEDCIRETKTGFYY